MEQVCKHPRVRVVAREEDAEFVECQECGEVFDSSEFNVSQAGLVTASLYYSRRF